MSGIVSHGIHDYTHIKIVSIISSFDYFGHIIPLYVRLNGESLKVYNAYEFGSNHRILHFNCDIMDNDRVKPLKLSYHLGDLVWNTPVV